LSTLLQKLAHSSVTPAPLLLLQLLIAAITAINAVVPLLLLLLHFCC
jgi:hypothetical protein